MTTPSETPPTPAYAQPSYAQPAQTQPSYAQPAPQPPFGDGATATGSVPARNTIGLIALLLGIVVLISSTVSLLAQAAVIASGDYNSLAVVNTVTATVEGVLALAAVVCGGIGLALKGRSKAMAGIGLGIGVCALWVVLGGVFYGLVVSLMAG